MFGNRRLASAAILVTLLTTACASGGGTTPSGGADQATGQQPPAAEGSVVQIANLAPAAVTITVYMVPDGVGVDTPLGTVEGGQTRDFNFSGAPGRYRIRVVGSNGETNSDIFQLHRNSLVRWDLSMGRRPTVSARR